MGHYRRFAALFALSCFAYTSLIAASAAELPPDISVVDDPSAVEAPPDSVDASSGGEVTVEDDKNVYHIEADTIIIQPVVGDVDNPLAVPSDDDNPELEDDPASDGEDNPEVSVEAPPVPEEDEVSYPAISAYALDSGSFPFYGSCWVKGSTPDLGKVTLFFPTNYKEGCIGTDNVGRLFNVSNNSWSGVLYVDSSGVSYTVNFGSFGLPTYRRYSGSSYTNVTLYLTPEDGNLLFPDSPSPVYSLADLLPYLSILLLGGVFLCSMRRS